MKAYQRQNWGHLQGQVVERLTFETDKGYRLSVMTYGATILEYASPDIQGKIDNIVLAWETLEDYIGNEPRFGAAIGPVAGRIAGASFELDGQTYSLLANNGVNHLHSDPAGFDSSLFSIKDISDHHVSLVLDRQDGSGGYPGHLQVQIDYHLEESGQFSIHYQIRTDKKTLVNPTNHSYFNLSGNSHQAIDKIQLEIKAKGFYPLDQTSLPLGILDHQAPFFKAIQEGTTFGKVFASQDPQIIMHKGLDHPFLLTKGLNQASFYDPESCRQLTVWTDRPVLVIYTANYPDPERKIAGQSMKAHTGFALETQALPDAIHQGQENSVILEAGQTFFSQTTYFAGVAEEKS